MAQIRVDPERAHKFIADMGRRYSMAEASAEAKDEKERQRLETSDNEPESWRPISDWAVGFLDSKVCPDWELDDSEKAMFSESLAEVLDRYFPGAMQGFDNWHPIAKLVGATSLIAIKRVDFETGGFAPMHKDRKPKNADARTPRRGNDTDNGKEPEREDHGGYSTDGE